MHISFKILLFHLNKFTWFGELKFKILADPLPTENEVLCKHTMIQLQHILKDFFNQGSQGSVSHTETESPH